jgi:hypothetical protein
MESPVAPCIFLDDTIAIVLCPYCSCRHKHGSGVLGGRSAHCGKGEYVIGAPIADAEIGLAIKQRVGRITAMKKIRDSKKGAL